MSDEAWEIKTETVRVSQRPLPTPTPREVALVALHLDAAMRMTTAAVFGAPITRERAMADAQATLSEKQRILLAKDVTP